MSGKAAKLDYLAMDSMKMLVNQKKTQVFHSNLFLIFLKFSLKSLLFFMLIIFLGISKQSSTQDQIFEALSLPKVFAE